MGVAVFIVGAMAVIGHGLKHDSLGDKSLTFRWYYWKGAARMLAQHPLGGVGWGSFGEHYLGVRGPGAVEEVQDPHNFIMRAFAETGAIGGVLMIGWMLRLWWELTRPVLPEHDPAGDRGTGKRAVARMTVFSIVALLFGFIVSTDWAQTSAWVTYQSFRYLIGALLFIAAMVTVSIRSMQDEQLDDRPAPWLLYAMLVAPGMFLLHNLLDFAMSETAVLFIFVAVLGSAIGARQPPAAAAVTGRKRIAAGALVGGVLAWLLAAALLWIPTAVAESAAASGDAALRNGQFNVAVRSYELARQNQPLNADYAYRSALALIQEHGSGQQIRNCIASAIKADPYAVKYRVLSAQFEMQQRPRDRGAVESAYRAAIGLDPRNVRLRLEYAQDLGLMGDAQAATSELEQAIQITSQLPLDEPKRASFESAIAKTRRILEQSGARKPRSPGV